jgi:hypothetical protein
MLDPLRQTKDGYRCWNIARSEKMYIAAATWAKESCFERITQTIQR